MEKLKRRQILKEMKKRNATCAVYGLGFRDRYEFANTCDEVKYFSTPADMHEWFDTLESIYEPTERPVGYVRIIV